MNYIRQLDSIRAIAVLLVIITHWFPETHKVNICTSVFNGVDIFFVLSGFLITWILLKNRNEAAENGTNKSAIIKSFFIRRVIRIFPIYYSVIILLFLLGPATGTSIRTNILYFATYTSNFYFFSIQRWDGMLSHLWSLSVEEQFYIVWPWLMLFLNKKQLLPLIIASILAGVVAQIYFQHVNMTDILTFTCFYALQSGALIAWALVYKPVLLRKCYPVLSVLALLCFGAQIAMMATETTLPFLPYRMRTCICTTWAITGIMLSEKRKSVFFDTLFNNRLLIFIGKISYGIYVYHLIIPHFSGGILNRINAHFPSAIYRYNFYLIIFENFCLLIFLSYLSWEIIEKPILKTKKYFEYQKPALAELQVAAR